jgi:tetratricopeptide (TPR) repeat protein
MSKKNQANSKTSSLHESKPTLVDEGINQPVEEPGLTASDNSKIWRKAIILVPVALAVLFSINSLWLDFASDDSQQVLANVFIRDLKNLPLAFTTSVWSFASSDIGATSQPYYRPLFSALFTINYALFGATSPFGWHLVNVLIHALVTLFVFIVCKEFTQSRKLALVTASLFAVHPAHAESVAWISGVTDPLMSVFLLPAFYFYLLYQKSGKAYFIALVLLFFLLAMWCKETAIALPLVIAYCELFHFNKSVLLTKKITRLSILAALFVIPLAIYIALRHLAFGGFVTSDDLRYPLSAVIQTIPIAMAKYLWLVSVPVGYSYQHYTPFVTSVASLQFLAPLLLLVVIIGAIIFSKSPLLKFSGIWFLAFLAPALAGIINFDASYIVQERYLYLPLMGFCLAVALGIEWLASRRWFPQPKRLAVALVALIVMIWGVSYLKANSYWYDTVRVFQRAVEADPKSAEAHAALSITYAAAGRPREAEAESKKAVELDPQCASGYSNLSYFSKQAGRLDEAIAYLEQAKSSLALTPTTRIQLATISLNLGLLYAERKNYDLAEKTLQESNVLWPRTVGYYYLGQYYFARGRYEEALTLYQTVVSRLPRNYAPIHLAIGSTHERLGQVSNAVAAYNKYLETAPESAPDRDQVTTRIKQIQVTPLAK